MLYKCGAFVPSSLQEKELLAQNRIPDTQIIRRHGPQPLIQLERVLSENLWHPIKLQLGNAAVPKPFSQSAAVAWPGGYFDWPGPSKDAKALETFATS